MRELIAIIDDEPDILELVELHLKKAQFAVKTFPDGRSFHEFLKMLLPDLIVLDLMLPDEDGFEICKDLKNNEKYANIPVIMLTARGDETDKILGLELGADDYITKPFSPKELVARVKTVLRRKGMPDKAKKYTIGGIVSIDLEKYEVLCEGKRVDLTPTEFKILQLLCSHPGWVYSRDQILEFLWGQDKAVIDRTIDVHIKHLREKLGGTASRFIKNIRGVGYKLEP